MRPPCLKLPKTKLQASYAIQIVDIRILSVDETSLDELIVVVLANDTEFHIL